MDKPKPKSYRYHLIILLGNGVTQDAKVVANGYSTSNGTFEFLRYEPSKEYSNTLRIPIAYYPVDRTIISSIEEIPY